MLSVRSKFSRRVANISNEIRRKVSTMSEKEIRRLERLKRSSPSTKSNPRALIAAGALATTVAGFTWIVYDIKKNPSGSLGSLYSGSVVERVFNSLYELLWGRFNEMMEPAIDKAIPDWGDPIHYPPGMPPMPPRPLLVLDLERTILGSEHSAKYGWRHVKRPGLDKFIEQLRQYYEIVIFSENDLGAQMELLMEIDKENGIHKIGPSAAEMRGTLLLKRLDVLNRDEGRIIIIDDDPEAVQLCPRNTLLVKPYTDIRDKSDRVLLDLIPLLQAIVHEDVAGQRDIRDILDSLGTHDAQEAAIEYQMRVARIMQDEERKRNRALGGVLRKGLGKTDVGEMIAAHNMSPDSIVGTSTTLDSSRVLARGRKKSGEDEEEKPVVVKKKGQLWVAHEERERAVAERKQQAMEEEYYNRLRLQAEKEKKSAI